MPRPRDQTRLELALWNHWRFVGVRLQPLCGARTELCYNFDERSDVKSSTHSPHYFLQDAYYYEYRGSKWLSNFDINPFLHAPVPRYSCTAVVWTQAATGMLGTLAFGGMSKLLSVMIAC